MRDKIFIVGILIFSALLCFSDAVDAQTKPAAYETTADVNLRAGPGTNHPVITTLPRGIKINVVGKEGQWLRVESKHGGKPGYIDERFARRVTSAPASETRAAAPAPGPYRTLQDVDLREGPGTKYRALAKLPAGIKVHVVRAEGDWLRVESKRGGKPGYLERRAVEPWGAK